MFDFDGNFSSVDSLKPSTNIAYRKYKYCLFNSLMISALCGLVSQRQTNRHLGPSMTASLWRGNGL
jgi:hypothetical protein